MDKNELRYLTLFFAVFTALIFSGGKFNLFMFLVAVLCYSAYFVAVYFCYRIFRKGWLYVYKILKKYYKEISETLRRLGNSK